MVKAYDFALHGFEEQQNSLDDERENDSEDNCDEEMSKLCDEIFPKHSR